MFKRKFLKTVAMLLEPKAVSFPVDADILAVSGGEEFLSIIFAAPTPSTDPRATSAVLRLVWPIRDGDEVPHGALDGKFIGVVFPAGARSIAVFAETQEQALARAASRR